MSRKQSTKTAARKRGAPPSAPPNAALDPGSAPHRSALQRIREAQQLIYDAWDSGDPRRQIALAKEALRISPLCADAYVILARQAPRGSDKQLDLWRRGVEAGQAALGDAFADYVGEFWSFLETRPYMRARHGFASALWERGARVEAIDHLSDMLRLCPGDNLGVRYLLSAWLIEAGRDDDLDALFKSYRGDDDAGWSWTKALASFRRGGDGAKSRAALDRAVRANGYVAAYLLGTKRLPKSLPPFVSPGDEDEAVDYAARCTAGWHNTPGALAWLRERTGQPRKPKPRGRREGRSGD
jgi:tetratricopeptide (TPR) repeat protein